MPRRQIDATLSIESIKGIVVIRSDSHRYPRPFVQQLGKLAKIGHTLLPLESVLPRLVGDLNEHYLVLSSGEDLREEPLDVGTAPLHRRHQLGIGKQRDLRSQSITIVGNVDQLPQLGPIVGPASNSFSLTILELYRRHFLPLPRLVPTHH
jgi:hypothetical protein